MSGSIHRRLACALALFLALCSGARASDGAYLTSVGRAQSPPGSEQLCREAALACRARPGAHRLPDDAELAVVRRVNEAVNRRIRPVVDPQGIGASWTPPPGNVGDCKHYAVGKKMELVAAGVDPRHLMLAIVAQADGPLHAVLVYRGASGDLILDNLTDSLLGWRESGHTFIKMQDPAVPSRWNLVLLGPRAHRS